jgi:hypothetical protein
VAYDKRDALLCGSLIDSLFATVDASKKSGRPSEGKVERTPPAVPGVAPCSPQGQPHRFVASVLKNAQTHPFASHRVGVKKFADAHHVLTDLDVLNIENQNDIVPHVPPDALGFRAVGNLFEFDRNYKTLLTTIFSPAISTPLQRGWFRLVEQCP